MSAKSESNNLYKIGAIATLTGLSTHTIRAWERRYGMKLSDRTDGGTRLYDEHSLNRLKTIKQLLDQGESISVLSTLSVDELEERLEKFGSINRSYLNDGKSVFSGSLKVAVWGKSPFANTRYHLARGGSLVIEFTSSLESDVIDFLERNQSEIDCALIHVDFVNANNLESLIAINRKFPSVGFILLFNLGANHDLIPLMERGFHLIRGPLPESILVNSIGVNFFQRPEPSSNIEQSTKVIEERSFSPEQLERIMNSGGGSGESAGHLSMLIQNLTSLEDFCAATSADSDDDNGDLTVRYEVIRARNILEQALSKVCKDAEISNPNLSTFSKSD